MVYLYKYRQVGISLKLSTNKKKRRHHLCDTALCMFSYRCLSIITLPPRMRHSLIYNYLRELGVKMLQNAYKHPCSKHLTTVGKGTIFYRNSHKKIIKKHRVMPFLTHLGDILETLLGFKCVISPFFSCDLLF